jgi:transposase
MKMIKEVLRLHHSCGLSNKQISNALGCSRGAIAEYLHRAKAAGLAWPLPEEFDDAQVEHRLFPRAPKGHERPLPDFNIVVSELKKKGVTLLQLWSEYREEYPSGYAYTQFCEYYRRFAKSVDCVMRQEHNAGEKAFSDFAGKTMSITDPVTGAQRKAHLFVCTMGASNFTFAQLFENETSESWCNGHAEAFEYFGGVPKFCVPDNPKPVITKACPYEPEVNPSFAQMAAHYDTVVSPARVRKPKDKAKVEAAVGLATRWVLAVLRNRKFFSLAEARGAVRALVDKLNDRPFKKLSGCRRSVFEEVDRPALKPLPMVPYEHAEFKKAAVKIDYHVEFEKHFYSVPHQYRSEVVEIRVTATTLEFFFKGKRITSHPRSYAENKATTTLEHRPRKHQEYGEFPPDQILAAAQRIGPATLSLIEAIIQRHKHLDAAYRPCVGILRLSKKFDSARIEAACRRALSIHGYSYKSVKSILSSNLDQRPIPEKPDQLSIVHSNIRGPKAFKLDEEQGRVDSSNDRQLEGAETVRHGESLGDTDADEGDSRAVV